jgi:hypothetical protein
VPDEASGQGGKGFHCGDAPVSFLPDAVGTLSRSGGRGKCENGVSDEARRTEEKAG